MDLVGLDLVEEEVVGLVDLVDLDRREGLVVLGAEVVGPVDQTAQKGRKGVLVQVQEEAWGLMAGRLLRTLLEGGTMHLQKGE